MKIPTPNPNPDEPMFESLEEAADYFGLTSEQMEKIRRDMIATEPQDGTAGQPMRRNGVTIN